MGIFNFFKKSGASVSQPAPNVIYQMLFCDDLELYQDNSQLDEYPWNVLFSEPTNLGNLEEIAHDVNQESRVRLLAFNKLRNQGYKIDEKQLLGVVVEIGLEKGFDVLAVYKDQTARYLNYSGQIVVWENKDESFHKLVEKLFEHSNETVKKIGPWNEQRRPRPATGMTRISFLVSDGLYFGEAPTNVLFSDSLAGPVLASATEILKVLTNQ